MTGGGLCGVAVNDGLRREGDLMLRALVKDLADVPGVAVVTTRDARWPASDLPADVRTVARPDDVLPTQRRLIAESDCVWPIAPETGGALARLSELVLEQDGRLLGSEPDAVRLTASKRATAAHLNAHRVPAVPATESGDLPHAPYGWVVKPDDGAGCEDTHLFESETALRRWLGRQHRPDGLVVQPYVPGEPLSLSLLCRGGEAWLLSINRQDVIVNRGRFEFRGVAVGATDDHNGEYIRLARKVAAAIPGLWGYVGLDLVEGADGPMVLDINPRLTTSYAGLRRALGVNPASLVLDLARGVVPDMRRLPDNEPVEIDPETAHA